MELWLVPWFGCGRLAAAVDLAINSAGNDLSGDERSSTYAGGQWP